MVDDGEALTPLSVKAVMVYAKDWATFKESGDERTLDYIRNQVEQPNGDETL